MRECAESKKKTMFFKIIKIIYNKNIHNDIEGYTVNPWDTVCKLINASPSHLSSNSDNKLI